jgi:preprotein translocase subunit YajC
VPGLIIIVVMFVLLWALIIRPQRKRQLDQQKLLASIEPGDEVLTVGGLYGIVEELDEEDDLIVEIAEGIRVRIARRAVAGVVKPDDDADDVVDAKLDEDDAVLEAAGDEAAVANGEETVSEAAAR